MSSQDKALSNTEGKTREDLAGASGCGPLPQDNPDQQGSDKSGKMSSLDLSRLSTTPPLDEANKSIDSWLENTDTPFESGSPPIRNQENVPLSGDPGLTDPNEQTKEIEALTKGLPNRQGKSGTIAPTNTPQSRKGTGSRARAFSAGGAAGNRPHMGPQAKTMEDSDLPRPQFSNSNSGSIQGTIRSLPGESKFSITPDEGDPNSAERISSAHAPSNMSNITERSIPASQTRRPTSLHSPGTPVVGSSSVNSQNLLSHLLEQHRGFHPGVTKYLVDNVAGTPSPPKRAEPSLSPLPLVGSTVNAYGLAQPPSSLTFQDAEDVPILGSVRRHLGELVTEPEPLNYNSSTSRFQQCSDGGFQHNPWRPTGKTIPNKIMPNR